VSSDQTISIKYSENILWLDFSILQYLKLRQDICRWLCSFMITILYYAMSYWFECGVSNWKICRKYSGICKQSYICVLSYISKDLWTKIVNIFIMILYIGYIKKCNLSLIKYSKTDL